MDALDAKTGQQVVSYLGRRVLKHEKEWLFKKPPPCWPPKPAVPQTELPSSCLQVLAAARMALQMPVLRLPGLRRKQLGSTSPSPPPQMCSRVIHL